MPPNWCSYPSHHTNTIEHTEAPCLHKSTTKNFFFARTPKKKKHLKNINNNKIHEITPVHLMKLRAKANCTVERYCFQWNYLKTPLFVVLGVQFCPKPAGCRRAVDCWCSYQVDEWLWDWPKLKVQSLIKTKDGRTDGRTVKYLRSVPLYAVTLKKD